MTIKAFIVEDNPVIRDNLGATLEELVPLQVVGTAEGEDEALAWLGRRAAECQVVIVDLFLAEGSGLGVLERIRRDALPCRAVVLSNYAAPQMRQRCLELGAEHVFDKSRDIEQLVQWCAALPGGGAQGAPAAADR